MFETLSELALLTWALSIALELLALVFSSRLIRRSMYLAVVILGVFSSVLLLAYDLRLATLVIGITTMFRVVNAFRVIEERMKEPRLSQSSRRTSLYLISLQLVFFLLWRLSVWADVGLVQVVYGLVILSLFVSFILLVATRRNLRRSSMRPSDKYRPDMELPPVSICIPARNETADLPACLESILSSDYPKLEILVLDDCSHDKTSEIIKGFAQKGVRFILGDPPKTGWLAKNQAYQALAEAASGEVLVFCGVDTRFDKQAIRSLVGSMLSRKKQMISVLPKAVNMSADDNLIQPMRYWWELALPRRMFNRPPVLSTVWAIGRQSFFAKGEMKAVKNSVIPEGFFARELTGSDEYSFMRASGKLMISTKKQMPEQWQTAIRTRYPSLRKRPENVLLLLLTQAWLLGLPSILFFVGFFIPLSYLWVLAGINFIVLVYIHKLILEAWNIKNTSLGLALFPAAILTEMWVSLMSMWKYEFSEVDWKERNICIPVMRHYTKLPKI